MADRAVSASDAEDEQSTAAPENPFGDNGGRLMLTAPYVHAQLHAELQAAAPKAQLSLAVRPPADDEAPVSAQNPAWLWWPDAANLQESTAQQVVSAHVPSADDDPSRRIWGSQLAQKVSDLREKLSAGETLTPEELSTAMTLLLNVTPST